MRCGHCKASVEEAAGKIAGVKNPQVDLEAKELRFEESAQDFLENPCHEMREGRLLPAVSEHFKC